MTPSITYATLAIAAFILGGSFTGFLLTQTMWGRQARPLVDGMYMVLPAQAARDSHALSLYHELIGDTDDLVEAAHRLNEYLDGRITIDEFERFVIAEQARANAPTN